MSSSDDHNGSEDRQWSLLEASFNNSQLLVATVIEAEQDGLIVSVRGIRGIVPLSQLLMLTREELEGGGKQQETMAKLESRRGQALWLKVIQVDRKQHHVILSERLAQQEARKQLSEELLEELQVGDRRYGVVRVLAEFGAYVDLGGVDGLVHTSQLASSPVNHPREVVSVGEQVKVLVLHIDKDKKKISLSMTRA
jgi:small subunit ribosomal protein S1